MFLFNFTPLNPKDNITTSRNSLRILNTSLLELVVNDVTKIMQQLHKTQVTTIKGKHYTNNYLTRGDFAQLKAIFERYRDDILNLNPSEIKYVTSVMMIYAEANDFEKVIGEDVEKISTYGSVGNVEIRKRPVQNSLQGSISNVST